MACWRLFAEVLGSPEPMPPSSPFMLALPAPSIPISSPMLVGPGP